MREALKMSRNVPAIKTAKEVGSSKSKDFSEKLGIPLKHRMNLQLLVRMKYRQLKWQVLMRLW